MALTTATAVAMSGTAVAGAAEPTATDAPLASSSDSIFGSADTNTDETDEAPAADETEPAGSGASFFGWDADTTTFEKLKDAFGVITVLGSAIGAIVALASNIDKLIKLFPAQ